MDWHATSAVHMHDLMAIWAKGSYFLYCGFDTDANAPAGTQKKRLGVMHFNHASRFSP
jgi:hypothetical protein